MNAEAVTTTGGGTFCDQGDPDGPHVYRNHLGVRMPSVTQAMEAAGFSEDLDGAPEWALEAAGERGTFLHRAIVYALEGDLDWSTLDATLKPVVRVALRRLKEARFELVRAEEPGVSERYSFGYTIDLEGRAHGAESVIDIKSGSKVKVGPVGVQTAAYALARVERDGLERRPERYVLRLWPREGEARLIKVPSNHFEDEADFLAALRAWYRQRREDLGRELR